jgi:hypothetical protein
MTTQEDLEQDIRQADERTFERRLQRYRFFFTLPEPENGLWLNEPECSRLIEEAFWSYIDGSFVGCILLCQATLENLIRTLVPVGDTAGFKEVIEAAYDRSLITNEERDDLNKLRTLRNQFTHIRPGTHTQALWRQRIREGKNEDNYADDAAQFALRVMFTILAKPPFAL